ncbi:hypothetical protein [Dehalobacter sp. TeCB1]|uniref:hypothetical protein n=1 Tax=Dehalobacter sp. TeCB1 TaxID=1843715 RepID=UPI00083A8EE3|nr:hypothetical protein [Dehalobacter sp. TeCB1]OCZ52720.1 hypothetical protein A7D23_09340 [Dehalobacter sp. TeCB1]
MRSNAWGRPPQNDIWGDIKVLALWIFIVGIVGYLLFPDFFHNVYDQLTSATANTEEIGEITLPTSSEVKDTTTGDGTDTTSVYNSIYTGDSEISDGYWALFVGDNEFQQLSLSTESYAYIIRLIDGDRKGEATKILLLSANGNIHKYVVTEEVYNILLNLNMINNRSGTI